VNRWLRRASRWILLAVLGLVLAYEEVQWRLSIVFALLGKLPVLRAIESRVKGLPPYGALALFVLPSAILFPLKMLALYWLAGGKKTLGIGTILIAKVMGTALVARIFQLTREALLTIGWCQWLYDKVMSLRQAAYAIWQSLPVVRWWRARWAKEKALGGFWKRRWKALRERFGNRAVKIK
jgi:hypothetical protein